MILFVGFISIFYHCWLIFKHDFIRFVNYTCVVASNTASNDVTSWVKHRIFNTYLSYSSTHVAVKMYEKYSLNGMVEYDLRMIRDSGLLYWATYPVYIAQIPLGSSRHVST